MSTEYYMDGRTYYLADESSNYKYYKDDEGNEYIMDKETEEVTNKDGKVQHYNSKGEFEDKY